jgi:hypothetical protein
MPYARAPVNIRGSIRAARASILSSTSAVKVIIERSVIANGQVIVCEGRATYTRQLYSTGLLSTIKAKKPMRTSDGKNNIAQSKISKHLLVRLSRYLEYIWSLIALIKLCSLLIYRKCSFRGFVPIKAAALSYAEL